MADPKDTTNFTTLRKKLGVSLGSAMGVRACQRAPSRLKPASAPRATKGLFQSPGGRSKATWGHISIAEHLLFQLAALLRFE